MKTNIKKHFYTFLDNGEIHYHGLVEITSDNYVNNTPIEDYGDYLLMDIYISKEQAQEIFSLISQSERIENAK